jgi:hypothetical protein
MKEVKFLLALLASAAYTSGWWALARWGPLPVGPNGVPTLGIIMPFTTTIIIGLCVGYCVNNWKR